MRVRSRSPRGLSPLSWIVAAMLAGAPAAASAQTSMIPYFGKNNIHYDNFNWSIYQTDHFEIYYYDEIAPHLERVAGYAESAYQQISADLKHDLSFKVQLILFKTHSEFEQQNIEPSAGQEGVGAFAEPIRQRMVMPIDDPPDLLYGLIVHELTHQFEFDIIPAQLVRRGVPLWVNEGLSEYERGQWTPMDLMSVRDAAVADIIPKMSETDGYGNYGSPRFVPYNLGHAVFEFIEARFGKEGIRQFMFSLRKSVIGGGEDAYEEALQMSREEFDQAFDRYLKDRFKPFRDKERPADYGRNIAPNAEKTRYAEAFSIAPSPSGDLIAAVTINRRDGEIDIVLLSTKDGSVVRNLTDGFDKDLGYSHIVQYGNRFEMPWLSWSPKGDRIAYFVRTEKERTLILQNVITKAIEVRIPMKTVDEPESPNFAPDGRSIAFAGLRGGIGDIFRVDLDTLQITNVTGDAFADMAPTYSPDGRYLVYVARVSGNQKLFRVNLDGTGKTQLTFGTHDDTAAQFLDDRTLVFSSTATDPAVPLEPDVAKNGNIYNIWTLDLNSQELRQYTDVLGGNWSAVVLNDGKASRIAFISYYKGEFALQTIERKDPLHTAMTADFGAPGPIIDFQAPLQHTLVRENARPKKRFEKMFLEGRPPINVGVSSSGDILGGTQVTFGDVLGDKQFNMLAESVQQYRTLAFSYVDLSRRFQLAVQGYSQTLFFYAQAQGIYYDPSLTPFITRDLAVATRTSRGGQLFGIYPMSRYRRLELSGGIVNVDERYNDETLQQQAEAYQQQRFGGQVFRNGTMAPLGVAFVQETTVFREFGPLAGNTMRLAYNGAPKLGGLMSRQTVDADVRHYLRLGGSGLLATRFRGFRSFGEYPDFLYFGGNSEMRGYEYLEFTGQNVMFANAELRFPMIEAMLTPVGVMGGVRGVFFFNVGGGWFDGRNPTNPCGTGEFKFFANDTQLCAPASQGADAAAQVVSGFRLQDARASYGIGLETFALGFPIHFDWSWRTLFNKEWENVLFASQGGSYQWRKPQFAMWIGYDF